MNTFRKLASDFRRGKIAAAGRKPPERDPRNRYKHELEREDADYAEQSASEGNPIPEKKKVRKKRDDETRD